MVPMDLVAVDQGAAERFSPDTPLCIGGRPFQTAFPEGSGPYTLGSLVKVMGLAKLDKKRQGCQGARAKPLHPLQQAKMVCPCRRLLSLIYRIQTLTHPVKGMVLASPRQAACPKGRLASL